MPSKHIAVDLGASSARVFLGALENGRLDLRATAIEPNVPIRRASGLYWNIDRLFGVVCRGIAAASREGRVHSVGVDSWGVDFGLIDCQGSLIRSPFHYRDDRTSTIFQAMKDGPFAAESYAVTGVQNLPINTLYQLLATDPRDLERAATLLFIPDLFVYLLTGDIGTEETIASTSQLLNAKTRQWSEPLLESLGLPASLLPRVGQPGARRGTVTTRAVTGLDLDSDLQLVSPASHDTASAVVSIPADTNRFAFVSSGTWSIVGMEVAEPVINEHTFRANISNEAGVSGTTRLVKNVMGLWLLEESIRVLSRDGITYTRDELLNKASALKTRSVVDPDDVTFISSQNIPDVIRDRCRQTGQPTPEDVGELARCILVSLALAYRRAIELISVASGVEPEVVHIVGGGSKNRLLCSLTSSACGLPVIAGPVEATAAGNILIQAAYAGVLTDLDEARMVARRSPGIRFYEPLDEEAQTLSGAYATFLGIVEGGGEVSRKRQ